MSDLFGSLIPGLLIEQEVIDAAEEAELDSRVAALDLAPFRFQGWIGKRLTRSFGWAYDFDRHRVAEAEPMPDWLTDLRDRTARRFALPSALFVQALVTRYDPGAGIGWHRDRPVFDRVLGVSLLSPAILRFRQRTSGGFRRTALDLPPRSAYLLSGEVRRGWEHGIAEHRQRRLSITFRSLA